MLFRDVITLLSRGLAQDPITGEMKEVETAREVFANKKSVRQTEFYAAAMAGLKPELMFEIRSVEYQGERRVEYQGKRHDIIRTFDKGEMMELVCSGEQE